MKDNGIKTVFFVLLAVLIGVIIYSACCRHSCDGLDDAKLTPNDNETISGEGMLDHTTEAEKTAFFDAVAKVVYFRDGVLTIRREYEQEASEEEIQKRIQNESAGGEFISGRVCERSQTIQSRDTGDERSFVESNTGVCGKKTYAVAGVTLDTSIAEYLRSELESAGIGWWLPYALAQTFQESAFNPLAENPNGLDKGLLQYRITYWPSVCREHGFPEDTSIFDWKTQICIYAADTARRLRSGLSIYETISRHNTSDYGQYNATYVQQVTQWVR